MKLDENFLAQMREATQLLQSEGPAAATAAIQRALHGAAEPAAGSETSAAGTFIDINPVPVKAPLNPSENKVQDASEVQQAQTVNPAHETPQAQETLDKVSEKTPAGAAKKPAANAGQTTAEQSEKLREPSFDETDGMPNDFSGTALLKRLRQFSGGSWARPRSRQPMENWGVPGKPSAEDAAPGKFLSGSCSHSGVSRQYKLYIPSGYRDEALPLVVMLHGCKQNPDDFAAGTGMNRIAEKNNFLVVYPAQNQAANGSNCWNWFNAQDQKREGAEPAIIAAITRQVMAGYRVDPNRVYVAGLSAGGAMATILTSAYPELYAAVGIHSGLPVGSAHDVPSAFGAMKDGSASKRANPYRAPVPAIVFHGDRDHTVHPANGVSALAQCLGDTPGAGGPTAAGARTGSGNGNDQGRGTRASEPQVEKGQVPQGRAYTRKIYRSEEGLAVAEHWIVHGSGHAWSGGATAGSYTDPKGPDASQEMMRFFALHRKGGGSAPSAS